MNQCHGIKRNLTRCQRTGDWRWFCEEHKRQPLVWFFVLIFTVCAGGASIYSCVREDGGDRAVLQNMQNSPGGIQVAGDVNINTDPLRQPIANATATVAITIQSDAEGNVYSAHKGGVAAFGKGNTVLLQASAMDSWRRQLGNGVVRYHSVFSMPADSPGVGESVESLRQAEYIQTEFKTMPTNSLVTGGTVVFAVNNSVRLEFAVPEQRCAGRRVFIRNLAEGLRPLASNTHKRAVSKHKKPL